MKDYKVLIIGTGAAGYAAALSLWQGGEHNIAILTDHRTAGTSRNAGSDKQTYYKLSISGDTADSVAHMAHTLFEGGSVDGDTAYAEAAGSVRAFLRLCELGVPFPTNEMGEFVGYKTDNDPQSRATSAGPLTSKLMTEALERAVFEKKIPCYDNCLVTDLVRDEEGIIGVAFRDDQGCAQVWACSHVILATGGPAGIYRNVVYPRGHYGMTGLAIRAGAALQNFAEWQYGIASIKFRWNLSGSYQQVLPRYFSMDQAGKTYDFLSDALPDTADRLLSVFLKGYQWPFSARHIQGSTRVDLAIFDQLEKGRRVFMDYTQNPEGYTGIDSLPEEARNYLVRSDSTGDTPYIRLMQMNPKAVDLYKDHQIDLEHEYLEISLSAQHCNGGVAVDEWWQSTVPGLYVIGEAAGTFGAVRPGGSALNSGQVGAMRAADACLHSPSRSCNQQLLEEALHKTQDMLDELKKQDEDWGYWERSQELMSSCASVVRRTGRERDMAAREIESYTLVFPEGFDGSTRAGMEKALRARDSFLAQLALLSAEELGEKTNQSRGSAVYQDADARFMPEDIFYRDKVMITQLTEAGFLSFHRPVRPFPMPEQWFEIVWKKAIEREKSICIDK